MIRLFLLTLLLTVIRLPAIAQSDWPQFRGPGGQGHAGDHDVPLEWSETRNILWKSEVPGLGWSSPVISNGRLWLTTAIDDDKGASLRAIAFDVETGKEIGNTEIFRISADQFSTNVKNSDASATPILEGDRVYVHFGMHGTAALTTSGEILWKTRLPYESQHGGGGSPILYKDLLIVNCDGHDQAYVIALDKNTGKQRWKTPRRRPWDQAYTTPLLIRVGDQDQIVSVGAHRTVAYDPANGKEIWRVRYDNGFSNVPRPVYGHGMVYIATGFQQPSLLAVRTDGTGDVTETHVQWALRRSVPFTPSPILVGSELYLVSDIGIATCLDATTGNIHWQARLGGGNYSASPVFVDGRVYFQSESGVTTVIKPATTAQQLARNALDGATLASMAVSDSSLFLRTHSHVYRIGSR